MKDLKSFLEILLGLLVLLVGGAGALWLDARWFRFLFCSNDSQHARADTSQRKY